MAFTDRMKDETKAEEEKKEKREKKKKDGGKDPSVLS